MAKTRIIIIHVVNDIPKKVVPVVPYVDVEPYDGVDNGERDAGAEYVF
jgi:hypothetical protein